MYPPQLTPTHVVHHNRGYGYGVVGVSGTIAAGLAQDSLVFALMCGQQAGVQASAQMKLWIDRLRIVFTTIAAFTTPITASRRLGIYRGAAGSGHALPTVGTALTPVAKDLGAPATVASAFIAATGAMTPGSVTREANPIMQLDLVAAGAAGARQEMVYELAAPYNAPQVIGPDQLLLVSNPVAMDAGGTWQLAVDELHWIEQSIGALN